MSSIEHFRTELRIKFEAIEAELADLERRMERGDTSCELLVRTHLERLSRHVARKLPIRSAAESVLKRCGSHDKPAAVQGTEPSRCMHSDELNGRLTCARKRACAAMDIVVAAIDQAAHAALEAWLAETRQADHGSDRPDDSLTAR